MLSLTLYNHTMDVGISKPDLAPDLAPRSTYVPKHTYIDVWGKGVLAGMIDISVF